MNWVYLLSAFAIGMAFSAQPSINGVAVRTLGTPIAAAALSVAITLATLLILLPFAGGTLRPPAIVSLPWWVVFGGLIGAAVVAGGAAIAPATGAAVFFVCLIAGQLVGSALIDQSGAFGMAVQAISWAKAAGLALVLAGVVLVRLG
ncbi:MAG: DMT family transporter [Rhodobacter sp.]|nr:DMT family transporter [Rhodobacter sp.]